MSDLHTLAQQVAELYKDLHELRKVVLTLGERYLEFNAALNHQQSRPAPTAKPAPIRRGQCVIIPFSSREVRHAQ